MAIYAVIRVASFRLSFDKSSNSSIFDIAVCELSTTAYAFGEVS